MQSFRGSELDAGCLALSTVDRLHRLAPAQAARQLYREHANFPPSFQGRWAADHRELSCRPSVLKSRWIFVSVACVLGCKQPSRKPLGARRFRGSAICSNGAPHAQILISVSGDHRFGLSDSGRLGAEYEIQFQRNTRNTAGKRSQEPVVRLPTEHQFGFPDLSDPQGMQPDHFQPSLAPGLRWFLRRLRADTTGIPLIEVIR